MTAGCSCRPACAGGSVADQRERAAPPRSACSRPPEADPRPQPGPGGDRAAGRPVAQPARRLSCCSTCSSRSTSASPIATSWRRARQRGSTKRGVALGDVLGRRWRSAGAAVIWRRHGSPRARRARWCARSPGQFAELTGQLTMRLEMRPEQKARSVLTTCWPRPRKPPSAAISRRPRASTRRRCAPTLPTRPALQSRQRVPGAGPLPRRPRPRWPGEIAVARDPAFAEAWYNLALAAGGRAAERSRHRRVPPRRAGRARLRRRAVQLALLLTKLDRCSEGAGRVGTLPRTRTVVEAGGHRAEGDCALPHEDPAGTGAGGLSPAIPAPLPLCAHVPLPPFHVPLPPWGRGV